jgi:hypothetical protein
VTRTGPGGPPSPSPKLNGRRANRVGLGLGQLTAAAAPATVKAAELPECQWACRRAVQLEVATVTDSVCLSRDVTVLEATGTVVIGPGDHDSGSGQA